MTRKIIWAVSVWLLKANLCGGFALMHNHLPELRIRSNDETFPFVLQMTTTTTSGSSAEGSSRRKTSRLQSLSNEALLTRGATTAGSSSNNNNNNLLEDSSGHINRILAERIFEWEQHLRSQEDLPQVDYSIRSGLRLVEKLVQEFLEERKTGNSHQDERNYDALYADLVQEGLAALLDAMKHYRDEEQQQHLQQHPQTASSGGGGGGFALYAQQEIRKQLESSLNVNLTNKPLRLPQSVLRTVQKARTTARQMQSEQTTTTTTSGNSTPTMDEVAQRLDMPVAQLRDYLNLYKRAQPPALSMESTVEISHPLLDDDVQFTNQDDWEKQQQTNSNPAPSSNDSTRRTSTTRTTTTTNSLSEDDGTDQWISEYFMDTLLEGDDQAWIVQQEQHAGQLSDLIPDTQEPSPDDLALSEMIRHDLYEFLSATLTEQEHAVIRTVFGLDTGKQSSIKRAAQQLGLESNQQALDLLTGGLQKLRESYTKRYVEPYLESEPPVDSV